MKRLLMTLLCCLAFSHLAYAATDINTATQAELEAIHGIGPAKAKAIIDYRSKNGPFKNLSELDKVRGFGKTTVKKLRGDLTVSKPVNVTKPTIKQDVIVNPAQTKSR